VGALMCGLYSWRFVAGPLDTRTHAAAPYRRGSTETAYRTHRRR
jgi:hypothetical protein